MTPERILTGLVFCLFCAVHVPLEASEKNIPAVSSAVTFLYYNDIDAAEDFYGNLLGFKKDFDGGWVKIFRITDGGRVGLVDETEGYLKTSSEKPVMLSVDTPDIEGWYRHVRKHGAAYIKDQLKAEADEDSFVRSFMLTDPGGYHVEFFQWKEEYKKY